MGQTSSKPSTTLAPKLPTALATAPSSIALATEPSIVLATEPSISLATEPSIALATEPSIALATEPSISLATEPSIALATEPSIALATEPSTIALASPQADYKTRVNVDKFTFTWEIENFSHCAQQNGEELLSGTFSGEDSSVKWQLEMYVRGEDQESKEYVSLYVSLVESDRNTVDAKYSFSLKNDKGECSFNKGDESLDDFSLIESGFDGWGYQRFIERSYLLDPTNGLLPDDKLTIVCSMAVSGETVAGQVTMSGSGVTKFLPSANSIGQTLSSRRLSLPQSAYYSKTRVNITNSTFTWEIENFSHCPKRTGEDLLSDTFSTEDSKVKWCLQMFVWGMNENKKDYVSLFLKLVESNGNNVGAKYRFSLKNGRIFTKAREEMQHTFRPDDSDKRGWGWPKFVKRSYLLDPKNGLLRDDKLTIKCSIAVAEDIVNIDSELTVPSSRLDMAKLYIDHEFDDFVALSVGEKQFDVHRAILMANSPVFAAMFDHDTKESQMEQIDIEDTEPEVMKELLQFLYTGSAPNLKSMADRLLVLADKYQVEPLKIECEEAMCEEMEVENACAILVQADRLSATRLKSYTIRFMTAKATQVFKSEGFKSLMEQYPELHIETLQTMAANRFKTM